MSHRTERVAAVIRQVIGRMLVGELADPRIGFVTLTRVTVSADLRSARVFVSILGSESDQRTALRGLNSARKRIRGALGERINLRLVPEVSFCLDAGVKRSIQMSSLLADLAQEREAAEGDEKAEEPEVDRAEEEPDDDDR